MQSLLLLAPETLTTEDVEYLTWARMKVAAQDEPRNAWGAKQPSLVPYHAPGPETGSLGSLRLPGATTQTTIHDIMRAIAVLKNDLQRHQTLPDAPVEYDLLLVAAQEHLDDAMDDLEQIQQYEWQAEDEDEDEEEV
jgi:hypothetical protein